MYLENIRHWLEVREQSPDSDLKSCFPLAFDGAYTNYLIIPGAQDINGDRIKLIRRWNGLLLDIFSRTEPYRRSESVLLEELLRFYRDLEEWDRIQRSGMLHILSSLETGIDQTLCIGREREIQKLANLLEEQDRVVLYGQGGIGKSTIARAYTKAYRSRYDTIVFASCEAGLQRLLGDDSQLKISGLCYVPEGRRGELGWYCRRKLQILSRITNRRTLIILDNLDQRGDRYLERFRELPCKLLITTRLHPNGQTNYLWADPAIAVQPLPKEQQLQLFESCYGAPVSDQLLQMAGMMSEKLEGNTLRIRQLGLFSAQKKLSSAEDLSEFSSWGGQLFRLEQLTSGEQSVLRNACLLPLRGIGLEKFLLLQGRSARPQVLSLVSLGLLEYDQKEQRIYLHPLVLEEAVRVLKPGWYLCRNYVRHFMEALEDFWNFTQEQKNETADYLLCLANRLSAPDARCMEEIFTISDLVWQLGHWEFSMKYIRRLYEYCRKQLGEEHGDTARAAHLMGTVYFNQNMQEQAAEWYRLAWTIYEQVEEKEPLTEACLCMKYTRYLLLHGEYKEMEALFSRIETIYRRSLREEKNEKKRRSLKTGLLNFYIQQERAYLKLEQYEKALEICRKAERHHRQIKDGEATKSYIYSDMSQCFWAMGNCREALDYIKKAVQIADEYLTDAHSERQRIIKTAQKLMKEYNVS